MFSQKYIFLNLYFSLKVTSHSTMYLAKLSPGQSTLWRENIKTWKYQERLFNWEGKIGESFLMWILLWQIFERAICTSSFRLCLLMEMKKNNSLTSCLCSYRGSKDSQQRTVGPSSSLSAITEHLGLEEKGMLVSWACLVLLFNC